MKNTNKIKTNLYSLVIFRNILNDEVVKKFIKLTESLGNQNISEIIYDYSEFAAEIFKNKFNLSDYILNRVLEDENIYIVSKAQKNTTNKELDSYAYNELKILEEFSKISSNDIKEQFKYEGLLAEWKTTNYNFIDVYKKRLENIKKHGYGIFAKYSTFMLKDSNLVPVKNPDRTKLSNLGGYEYERELVINNTLALLEGKPAANVLLYGDSGTGKSSTVKAIANEYKHRGLRLIEIRKKQLRYIPDLLDSLSLNPLKFILFIDDLSFTKNDDDFAALKAILEGSVSAKSGNLVIYATSNRRHLIKEDFSDRDGNDIHLSDTIEELVSLSERFGLTVTFSKPNKEKYLEVVEGLAKSYDIKIEKETLFKQAESYAIGRNGRSPRVAKQFIEYLKATQE